MTLTAQVSGRDNIYKNYIQLNKHNMAANALQEFIVERNNHATNPLTSLENV
jgi:hypothetical protein